MSINDCILRHSSVLEARRPWRHESASIPVIYLARVSALKKVQVTGIKFPPTLTFVRLLDGNFTTLLCIQLTTWLRCD